MDQIIYSRGIFGILVVGKRGNRRSMANNNYYVPNGIANNLYRTGTEWYVVDELRSSSESLERPGLV